MDLAPLTVKIGAGISGLTKGLSEADAKVEAFANNSQQQIDRVSSAYSGFADFFTKKNARMLTKRAGLLTATAGAELSNGFDSASSAVRGLGGAIGASLPGPLGIAAGLVGTIGSGIVGIFEKLSRDKIGEKVQEQLSKVVDGVSTLQQAYDNLRQGILRTGLEQLAQAERHQDLLRRQGGLGGAGAALQGIDIARSGRIGIARIVEDMERARERLTRLLADPAYQRLVNTMGIERAQSGIVESTASLRDQLATLNMTAAAAERYRAIHELMRRTTLSEAEATLALSGQLREQANARRELAAAERARNLRNEANNLIESSTQELRILEGRVGLLQQANQFQVDMTREEQQLQRLRARGLSDEQALTLQVMNDRIQTMREWVAMLERGRSIAEGLLTPLERFDRSIRELDTLFSNAAITEDVFNRGILQAVEQLERANVQANQNGPAAMMEGSAAALSTLARFQRQNGAGQGQDRMQRIENVLEESRAEQRRIRQEAAEMAREIRNLTVPTVARF